jgi:hypothetical protein
MPSPGLLPHPGERIQWAGAADAQHLYLAMSTLSKCPAAPCAKTIWQLVGSDDGGRTWSDRGAPMNIANVAVLGTDRLMAAVLTGTPSPGMRKLHTSTDGGRSWHPTERAPAVAAVPTGSAAVCWPDRDAAPTAETWGCALHALDPVSHRLARLTAQPPLALGDNLLVEESGGRFWVPGIDRATGRPAVAVSANAGRTWSAQVFADAPACPAEGCLWPTLAMGAGGTTYAVSTGERDRAVYRLSAGRSPNGGWQRISEADRVPYEWPGTGGESFVAADGTHLLGQLVPPRGRDGAGYRFWAARGGGTYEPVELDGLPAAVYPIQRSADGWFYTHGGADDLLYGSSDGWHWSPVTRRS